MNKIILTLLITLLSSVGLNAKTPTREYWSKQAYKMSFPVLDALSKNELKEKMPVEQFNGANRQQYAHLEALGRLLCGIAPWLELPVDNSEEGLMRAQLLALAHKGLDNAVNPDAKDYLNFKGKGQPLVDAAFLAQAFIRSPQKLWGELNELTKERLIKEFKKTRATQPPFNNWLLFSAMVEVFLQQVEGECEINRVDRAVTTLEQWYVGDGQYKDGPIYHNDYYNSFVIQPMLLDIIYVMNNNYPNNKLYSKERVEIIENRASRYAEVLERSISPEGTFPVVGRSILYRTGCMQSLSQAVLLKNLPRDISEGQVREALTLVMKNLLETKDTYKDGWLTMGFGGAQRDSGESYLCTGSMYLASTIFLTLGLQLDDTFWTDPAQEWTAKKAWSGKPFMRDRAIKN